MEKYGNYYNGIFDISIRKNINIENMAIIEEDIKKKLLNCKYNIKYVLIHINPI